MIDDSRGLIFNHWRGNYPLATAFWGNTVTIPGAILACIVGSAWNIGPADGPAIYVPFILYGVLMTVSIWSLKGTCISIVYHVRRGGLPRWRNTAIAGLLFYLALLAVVSMGMAYLTLVFRAGSGSWN
jgi:hypothetical protein